MKAAHVAPVVLCLVSCAQTAQTPVGVAASANCAARHELPDPSCTPGAVMTTDLDIICRQSTKNRRHVTAAMKRAAFERYGLRYPQPEGAFEVDHLIPLELGGDNVAANLWPQPAAPAPGFHEKDKVETLLHKRVCTGEMSLAEAQRLIATNWLVVWEQSASAGGDDGEEQ